MLIEENQVWCPPVELLETDTALILKVEMPGIRIKDIAVRTTTNAISISGKRQMQHFANEREAICSQLHYGRIQCTIELPIEIQNKRVEAELVDGILTVTMPKVTRQEKATEQENFEKKLIWHTA
jgi:HSP20 family protein